ncbi:hypothetical protein [Paenibacillus prosopidis]|uniref:Uncharacterized protein n=1 Tax=Paenibacillus prosopidis TaxID=630520 RepID=A0A368VQT4_9BACL|nr:hypothetical protein [Paenibacillus prosopidis]RCW44248.1 hypothetical protein DFP97_112112 [Paenibacillus prosopidis]
MSAINHKRIIHQASQDHIEMASNGLKNYLERVEASFLIKAMCDSLILALKDKNHLVTALYEEIDKMKELAK